MHLIKIGNWMVNAKHIAVARYYDEGSVLSLWIVGDESPTKVEGEAARRLWGYLSQMSADLPMGTEP